MASPPAVLIRTLAYENFTRMEDGRLVVMWRGFKKRPKDVGTGLSVYNETKDSSGEEGRRKLCNYITARRELNPQPGACWVGGDQIQRIGLIVRPDPNDLDVRWPESALFEPCHCNLQDEEEPDLCPTDDAAKQLARLATQNGGVSSANPVEK